jgi:hypothetical protein
MSTSKIQKWEGVHQTHTAALDPRQERFIGLYLDSDSSTFGNCFQSAIKAGYSSETARNLTHNRPKWLSEKLGQSQKMEPDLLLLKLTDIINSPTETTHNKLKAIDMMMKHFKMFDSGIQNHMHLTIESILD